MDKNTLSPREWAALQAIAGATEPATGQHLSRALTREHDLGTTELGAHQIAAGLVRQGLATRQDSAPISYRITPTGGLRLLAGALDRRDRAVLRILAGTPAGLDGEELAAQLSSRCHLTASAGSAHQTAAGLIRRGLVSKQQQQGSRTNYKITTAGLTRTRDTEGSATG